MTQVRTRIAPSPSGNLHVGTAHTALFNYLFTLHSNGQFILRIDDSDATRAFPEYEKNIIESLRWLGIRWDEGPDIGGPYGPYKQSERQSHYQKYIKKLLSDNKAYYCYCTPEELDKERKSQQQIGMPPKYSGRCNQLTDTQKQQFIKEGRKGAVRFRTPQRIVTFTDLIRGQISVDASLFGDFVIARGDGSTLLNLAATVDDIEMKITHAIRGEDFLNLVPRQILLFEALGCQPPEFAHLSFLYAADRTKLSKRHGATSVTEYKEMGILQKALVNYLATLGWAVPESIIQEHKNKGIPEELLDFDTIVKHFTLEAVKSSMPIFDIEKLKWMNGLYIRQTQNSELKTQIYEFYDKKYPEDLIDKLVPLAKERMKTLGEFEYYLKPFIEFTPVKLEEDHKKLIVQFAKLLTSTTTWSTTKLEEVAKDYVAKNKLSLRDAFMALRLTVTGEKIGLPLFETLEILGKETVMKRLQQAI